MIGEGVIILTDLQTFRFAATRLQLYEASVKGPFGVTSASTRLLIQVAANDSFRVADTGSDHFWFILGNSSGATGLETVGRSGEGRSASQL
jgi:hypothetical protein